MNSRRTLLRDIAVNMVLPYVAYLLLSRQGMGTVPALAASTVFPAAAILLGFIRERRVQGLGVIVLAGIAAGIAGALWFTSPFLLLARASFITGSVGILFLASLLAPRPLVFHIAASTGPEAERARLAGLWQTVPAFRALMRRMTAIWAAGLLAEAALRLALIPLLPVAVFLPFSEAMWIAFFALMIGWSYRYGRRRAALLQAAGTA